ncbi:MAG: DUF3047 domain-containing protein [Spongiibacteraceae bacterium]|nr:DUF3047 domain-containing protein [Spongiibacteraceae bacterium]
MTLLTILLSAAVPGLCAVEHEKVEIDDFSKPTLKAWQQKQFVGTTSYEVVQLDGKSVLKAQTKSSASALYKTLDIDLAKTPYLNWSWRVDNIYAIDNQQSKLGDDYPARLYIIVKEGVLPWQTKALNYVWSNKAEKQLHWPNPFVANAVMIPVRAGTQGLGKWHHERVNVKEDFYRIFNKEINTAHAVAIMSDSDNAKGSAVAYYGPIYFSK